MLSTNTLRVITCLLLLFKDFSILTECAQNVRAIPNAPLSINPPSVKVTRRKNLQALRPAAEASPICVATALTPPIPDQKTDSSFKTFSELVSEEDYADSELFFPFSFSVAPSGFMKKAVEAKKSPIVSDHVPKNLKSWHEIDEEEKGRKYFQKMCKAYRPTDSSKFKSIEQITKGAMASPLHFHRENNSPWSPARSSAMVSPVPLSPTAHLPQIKGKKWVKKPKKNLDYYYGGFPGCEYSDNEESEYEFVSDNEESECECVSDNVSGSDEDDSETIIVNGVKIYKPMENPKTIVFTDEDFNKSYHSNS